MSIRWQRRLWENCSRKSWKWGCGFAFRSFCWLYSPRTKPPGSLISAISPLATKIRFFYLHNDSCTYYIGQKPQAVHLPWWSKDAFYSKEHKAAINGELVEGVQVYENCYIVIKLNVTQFLGLLYGLKNHLWNWRLCYLVCWLALPWQ